MASGLAIGGTPSTFLTNAKNFEAFSHSPAAVMTELPGWDVSTGNQNDLGKSSWYIPNYDDGIRLEMSVRDFTGWRA